MLNKLLYERMDSMYESQLCSLYNKIGSKTGERLPGDITPELQFELENTLRTLAQITHKLIKINMSNTVKERFFWDSENQDIITLSELITLWETEPDIREQHECFAHFLNACQDYNNGTLTELRL